MGDVVKKTISLSFDLAKEAEAIARAEGKTLSEVIQDAERRSCDASQRRATNNSGILEQQGEGKRRSEGERFGTLAQSMKGVRIVTLKAFPDSLESRA
jgi:hypothetical protein